MAKIKSLLRDESDQPDDWYPPNWDYNYSQRPYINKRDFQNLDNNYKTGLRNMKILKFDSMGRYGIWPDWERIPEHTREQWNLTKYGPSYINTWRLYKYYIGFANMPYYLWNPSKDIIDPAERNKFYGLSDWSYWYYDPDTRGYEFWRGDIFPIGSPISDPFGVFPPELVRKNAWIQDGMTIEIDPEGYIERVTANVSPVCRTIKSKRV